MIIFLYNLIRRFLSFLILFIRVLIGVAFIVLLERKILGYIQLRKGPNKVGIMGLFQPFSDAIKLFSKERIYPLSSNFLVYYFCPIFSFILVFFGWITVPYLWFIINFNFRLLFILVCLRISVYGIIIAGWSSNRNYALLGGLRAVAQTISYEVRLAFIFLTLLIICERYNLVDFYFFQKFCWFIFCIFPLFQILFISVLAETNRTPFDFAEGESELVSGFNVEYRSGGFALIFLAEYRSIILIRILITILFFGRQLNNIIFYFIILFFVFLFIWIRGTYPRYRYDKLINLCWKRFLPVCLCLMIFYYRIKIFLCLINL